MQDLVIFDGLRNLHQKIIHCLNNEQEREPIASHGLNTVQKIERAEFARKIISLLES
jgi:hypothetical protein